jgi:FMN phosphatase YigB (HAD superfamily)
MVDFKKLAASKSKARPNNPRDIFNSLPKPSGINDLYASQAEVLDAWFLRRKDRDTVIKLHTGGGKTLVALLMAQSVMNETGEPVIYLAPTAGCRRRIAQQAGAQEGRRGGARRARCQLSSDRCWRAAAFPILRAGPGCTCQPLRIRWRFSRFVADMRFASQRCRNKLWVPVAAVLPAAAVVDVDEVTGAEGERIQFAGEVGRAAMAQLKRGAIEDGDRRANSPRMIPPVTNRMDTGPSMHPIVFLLDVDNTLLDNDRVQQDLGEHLQREFGQSARDEYWKIFEALRVELGYADYLGALQRYRLEGMNDPRFLRMSSFLVDYPFSERLYPKALDVVSHVDRLGRSVILSDGDVVFQPRKVQRSGLWGAVAGRVLIYVRKERMLPTVEQLHPAPHYVMVDDKLRILAAMKSVWGDRLTTIFVRQGHYALDRATTAAYPPADISIERIADIMDYDFTKVAHSGV